MACGQSTGPSSQHLVATSTDVLYCWLTGWMPAIGVDDVKAVLRNKAITGNFQSRLVMQTATTRTDNPSAPTLLEAAYSNAQDHCTDVLDVSATTATPMFVRFGAAYNLSSGTTPGQADVSLELSWLSCGAMMGGGSFNIHSPNTTSHYLPVTAWIPALLVEKVKAALIVTNALGNFRCQLAYRTATSIKESPSAWSSNLEGLWHGGDGEYPTGELSLSIASGMWVQIGIEHSLSSGSDGEALVTVAVGVRRA